MAVKTREELLKEVDGQLVQWRNLPEDSRVTISVQQLRALRCMIPPGRVAPTLGGVPAARLPHQHAAMP